MPRWTTDDIPDQTGRTVIVTGANSGLGEVTARDLAAKGAHVVLACRNMTKAEAAAARMTGSVEVRRVDLADLASVREFADGIEHVDVLINNAGLMAIPLARTADGFEMQVGTNHFGHFALTLQLLPKVTTRVVTLSSGAHRLGSIDLDDINWERRRYQRWPAYSQSKLANLMFAYELQRRLAASGSPVTSLAAHPGYSATDLQSHTGTWMDRLMWLGNRVAAQSADMGALPTLYAATVAELPGGEYIGPDGFQEMRGYPKVVGSTKASQDAAVAAKLWELSEKLTGVTMPV
jgi:NAD(P)-dependent dehydrogenase (short-subunit alcohol dehydrogenase family)